MHIQERTRRRWSLLELNEIIETAKKGLELGCTEALLVTGERPEAKYKEAINFLKNKNLISTIEWLYYVSKTLLELGIIPHTNAGLLTGYEMEKLKRYNASLGLGASLVIVQPQCSLHQCHF